MSTKNKYSIVELDQALRLLDHELNGLELDEPLQIRAIGGYALLKHGVREEEKALTADIDTVTRDYSAAVRLAIEDVARRTGLNKDWINNDNLGDNDPELVEAMYDAKWESRDEGLSNIVLQIADVPTLTRAKIIAADTAELADRAQDAPDLLRLVEHQGITSLGQFHSRYPDPFEEYPEANRIVGGHLARTASPAPSSRLAELKSQITAAADDLDRDDVDEPDYDY